MSLSVNNVCDCLILTPRNILYVYIEMRLFLEADAIRFTRYVTNNVSSKLMLEAMGFGEAQQNLILHVWMQLFHCSNAESSFIYNWDNAVKSD